MKIVNCKQAKERFTVCHQALKDSILLQNSLCKKKKTALNPKYSNQEQRSWVCSKLQSNGTVGERNCKQSLVLLISLTFVTFLDTCAGCDIEHLTCTAGTVFALCIGPWKEHRICLANLLEWHTRQYWMKVWLLVWCFLKYSQRTGALGGQGSTNLLPPFFLQNSPAPELSTDANCVSAKSKLFLTSLFWSLEQLSLQRTFRRLNVYFVIWKLSKIAAKQRTG